MRVNWILAKSVKLSKNVWDKHIKKSNLTLFTQELSGSFELSHSNLLYLTSNNSAKKEPAE